MPLRIAVCQTCCILYVKRSNTNLHVFLYWLMQIVNVVFRLQLGVGGGWYSPKFQSAVHSRVEDFDLWAEKPTPKSKQGQPRVLCASVC